MLDLTDYDTLDSYARLTRLVRASPPLALKAADAKGNFTAYASVFGVRDSYGERVMPGAFAESLSGWHADRRLPPLLWSHVPATPIGRLEVLEEDEKGLWAVGKFNLKTQAGRDAHAHVEANDVSGMSFGFTAPGPEDFTVGDDGVVELRRINLMEVSVVAMPANPAARITDVKALEGVLVKSGVSPEVAAQVAALTRGDLDLDRVAEALDRNFRAVATQFLK